MHPAPNSPVLLHAPSLPWRGGSEPAGDFIRMLDGYRSSGGVASAPVIAGTLRKGREDGHAAVARWIAAGHVVYFPWSDEHWLPLFQFARPGMSLLPGLARVLIELKPVLDPWDIAQWFVHPSPWLGGELPASLLPTQARHVLEAARADRFALAG